MEDAVRAAGNDNQGTVEVGILVQLNKSNEFLR
jgi:hypothetical protein